MSKRAIHTCVSCGKSGHWGKSWSWYGSLKDLDEGDPIAKFCSDPCKKKWAEEAAELRRQERAIRAERARKGMWL